VSIDEIRARLLPKFLVGARVRVTAAGTALTESAPERIREELHTLAGDAAMIGQPEIADTARACLAHARRWSSGDATGRQACAEGLAQLSLLIDALAAHG
jgi:hypothetical protein